MPKPHCSPFLPSRPGRRVDSQSGPNTTTRFFIGSFAATLSTALTMASFSETTALEEASSRHLPRDGHRSPPNNLLRHRRTVEGAEKADLKKSNDMFNDDDARTVVPLRPFSFRLSNLPPASHMLGNAPVHDTDEAYFFASSLVNTPAMDNLLEYVTGLGARTFRQSPVYGERFEGWDAGTVWSVGRGSGEFVFSTSASKISPAPLTEAEVVRIASDDSGDWLDDIFNRRMRRRKQRKLLGDAPSEGTIVLTLGHNGTVTFNDMYWEDAPDSNEMTDYVVQTMNADANKEGLLQRLRPLVCNAGDLIGRSCDVELDVTVVVEDAEVIAEGDAQGGTGEPELPMDDADGSEDLVTSGDPIVADDAKHTAEGDEQGTDGEGMDGFHASSLQDGTPTENQVVIDDAPSTYGTNENGIFSGEGEATNEADGKVTNETIDLVGTDIDDLEASSPSADFIDTAAKHGHTNSLESIPSDSQYPGVAVSAKQEVVQQNSKKGSPLQMIIPIVMGAILVAFLIAGLLYRRGRNRRREASAREDELLQNAIQYNMRDWTTTSVEATPQELQADHDNVMSSKSLCGGSWTPNTSRPVDASTVATAGASIAASSLAAAAGVPDRAAAATGASTANATKEIDKMLEDLVDGDSSFVSDSSPATTSDGDSDQEQRASGSVLGSIAGLFGGRKSVPPSPTPFDKAARVGSRLSTNGVTDEGGYLPETLRKDNPPSSGVQRQESFEGTYRARSAMQTLNLKKDILHVACDTHDTLGANSNDRDAAAGACRESGEYGVTRTISPQKSTDMKEKQRLAEKSSLSPSGRYQVRMASEEEQQQLEQREGPKPLDAPGGFKRSDSVHLVSWSSASSSDDSSLSSDYDSKRALPSIPLV